MQAKKRMKKARIARIEKTEEELIYEAHKGVLQMKVNTALSKLNQSKEKIFLNRYISSDWYK